MRILVNAPWEAARLSGRRVRDWKDAFRHWQATSTCENRVKPQASYSAKQSSITASKWKFLQPPFVCAYGVCVCACMYMCTCMHVCVYVRTCVYIVCVSVCICVQYACVCMHLYLCVCIVCVPFVWALKYKHVHVVMDFFFSCFHTLWFEKGHLPELGAHWWVHQLSHWSVSWGSGVCLSPGPP